MSGKWLPLAILLIVTLATSIMVMVEFWDTPEENCTTNCNKPSIMKIVSLVSWFFAWEVGLIMLLHVSLTCLSSEAGGYLPTVSGVIMYCVASFVFFTAGFMLAGDHEYTSHTNSTTTAFNVTNKEELVATLEIRYFYHSVIMMAAVVGFSIYSLIVCALMYAPRCDIKDTKPKNKISIIKTGCKSISTIAKELGRRIENPRNPQLQT